VAGQGFLILLDREDAKKLFAEKDPAGIRNFVEQLTQSKEYRKNQRVLELGTTWDGIHRCLTDGTLDPEGGEAPLNCAILGGKPLVKTDDYFASFVRPDMTPYVAEAVAEVRYDDFHKKYLGIDAGDYGRPLDEKDFEKLWVAFQQLHLFYESGAQDLSAVLFAAARK
jgi:hypothetical protein